MFGIKTWKMLCTLILLLSVYGCSEMKNPTIPEVEHGNFLLFIFNSINSKKEICVRIDSQIVVNKEFKSRKTFSLNRFEFSLDDGSHVLRATTDKGETSADSTFFLKDTLRCVIELVDTIPTRGYQFDLGFYDYPIGTE